MNSTMLDTYKNFNNICRICVKEVQEKNPVSLFADEVESKIILNNIQLCFQIILNFEQFLPDLICNCCIVELKAANSFRLKCISFDERFELYCKTLVEYESKQYKIIKAEELQKDLVNEDISAEYHDDYEQSVDDANPEFDKMKCEKVAEPSNNIDLKLKNNKVFKCSLCNRILKKKSSLLKHVVAMHQNRKHVGRVTGHGATRRYHCTKCTYSTPYSQTLITHIRRHTGEKPYRCECGKRFTDASTYGAHRRIHSSATNFTCSSCGKQFKFAKALKQHLRSHESGKFPCDICHKILKSRQTLQDHTRRHYNIRNFNCEDCGDTFVTSSELIHHKEKHNNDKKMSCHLCGYKTLRRKNLIIHLKRHANDRPYKCDSCEALFYSMSDVRRHQLVHTREKAYQCSLCPKGFTRRSALNKHIETEHQNMEHKFTNNKAKETSKVKVEKIDLI